MVKLINCKVTVATILCAFFVTVFFNGTSIATEEAEGNSSFKSLQNCMAVRGSSLNVVFLMDQSASMKKSDPFSVRSDMVKSSLEVFHQVSKDSQRALNYTYVAFGKGAELVTDWTPVNRANVIKESKKVSLNSKRDDSYGTDWLAGLAKAKKQIEAKKRDKKACFILSWMTDGEIDLNPNKKSSDFVPADKQAFASICSDSSGLINYFRKPENNIATIGALLSTNEAKLNNGKGANLTPKQKSVRLFRTVVEGKGKVPSDVISIFDLVDSNGEYQCGRITENSNLGTLTTSSKPEDLSWQFVDLIAKIRGLLKANVDTSSDIVQVDGIVGRLEVFAKGGTARKNLLVSDATGNNICEIKSVCRPTESSWVIDIPENGATPGSWKIDISPSATPYKVFMGHEGRFKKLALQVDESLKLQGLIEGMKVHSTATLVNQDGTSLAASDFADVCISQSEPIPGPECSPGLVTIPIDLVATSSSKAFTLVAEYKFSGSSEIGHVFYSQPMKVISSGAFAELNCADQSGIGSVPGEGICRLSPIPNRQQKSSTTLLAEVEKGKSTIKIISFEADDTAERGPNYVASIGQTLDVQPGQSQRLEFTLSNNSAKSEADDISGVIFYETTSANGQTVTAQLPVVFSIDQNKNILVFIGFYVLFILIGIGLPYLLLLVQARKSAVFVDEVFKYVSIPIKISGKGEILARGTNPPGEVESSAPQFVVSAADGNFSQLELSQEIRDQLVGTRPIDIDKGAKSITIGPAVLAISPIGVNALASIAATLTVSDALVVSNRGAKAEMLLDGVTTADQSLSGLIFIHASKSLLEPVSASSFVDVDENDFTSSARDSGFISTLASSSKEFEGWLVVVMPGEINYVRAMTKVLETLKTKNFEAVNIDLRRLRDQRLTTAINLHRDVASTSINTGNHAATENAQLADSFDDFDEWKPTSSESNVHISTKLNNDDEF